MSNMTIRLPGNEYPYNNCIVEEGNPSNLEEKLVFTTISKAGTKRRITLHPNGTAVEEILEQGQAL